MNKSWRSQTNASASGECECARCASTKSCIFMNAHCDGWHAAAAAAAVERCALRIDDSINAEINLLLYRDFVVVYFQFLISDVSGRCDLFTHYTETNKYEYECEYNK